MHTPNAPSSPARVGPNSPSMHPDACATAPHRPEGATERNLGAGISDAYRERAIESAGVLLQVFHAEHELYSILWKRDGCFSHKGAADRALANAQTAFRLMQDLIRNRSAAQVARMERERGLDLPACANEERLG